MTVTSTVESTSNKNTKNSSKFLNYIHNFRGFAILTIVATHTIAYLQWSDERLAKIAHILIANGTLYFVFIAGFLFQFLSHKYEYKKYLSKKLQYVLLPYVFTSIPGITLCIYAENFIPPIWFRERFSDLSIPGQILMYLLTGAHLSPFWFIPMITIFYIISPLLLWIDRHPKTYWILPTLLTITATVPRPDPTSNIIQSFVHFLSAYTMGMFCSHFKEKLFSFVQKRYLWLVVGFLILTVLEIVILPRPIAINSLSKLILCVLIIYFLWRAELRLPKSFHNILGFIAELSFGIYFLHDYFLIAYIMTAYKFGFNSWLKANLWNFSLLLLFGLGASIISILLIKRILGKKSRFVVGC